MTDLKHLIPTKLLWVDLEMTGLDPQQHAIIEVAAEITDFDFQSLASYQAVITQPEDVLAKSSDIARQMHDASGLNERVRTQGQPEAEVQRQLIALIKQQFGDEPAILAGNSIHMDRLFIRGHWPDVEALLHYRMLDVTSFKILMSAKYGVVYEKQEIHRAQGDIQESIAELHHYLEWFKAHPTAI